MISNKYYIESRLRKTIIYTLLTLHSCHLPRDEHWRPAPRHQACAQQSSLQGQHCHGYVRKPYPVQVHRHAEEAGRLLLQQRTDVGNRVRALSQSPTSNRGREHALRPSPVHERVQRGQLRVVQRQSTHAKRQCESVQYEVRGRHRWKDFVYYS